MLSGNAASVFRGRVFLALIKNKKAANKSLLWVFGLLSG